MTTPDQPRVSAGVPSGGEFAATAHSDNVPVLGPVAGNVFASITNVRDLDAAASQALSAGPAITPADDAVRSQWEERRTQILDAKRRRDYEEYATRLEEQAAELLRNAARANLRNIADELRTSFPAAATMVLAKDYDDGNLAIWVSSVQDKDGNDLPEPEDGDDARDTAQELVSQCSSRQLARFTESPVDLTTAAGWQPDGGLYAHIQR